MNIPRIPEPGDKNVKVISRDRKKTGRTTGGHRLCSLEGCLGRRIATKWSDGKITYPCSRGMDVTKNGDWKII